MRALLIEDDRRIAGFVGKGLRENSYAVDVANDGEEATYMASLNPYDIFILDVNLPKKNGFEVLMVKDKLLVPVNTIVLDDLPMAFVQ